MFRPHETLADKIVWWVKAFVVTACGSGLACLFFAIAYTIMSEVK